jgi:microcystin-dependent protein
MAKSRRSYKGAAVSNTIASGGLAAGATTISLGSAMSGWSTASTPFFVVVDPGTAKEEKICVKYATTTSLTVVDPAVTSTWAASVNGRGADNTTDRTHDGGAVIYPVFTATEADNANELVSTYTANGDLVVHGSTTFKKIAVGTNSYVLQADSSVTDGGVKWGQVATAGIADSAVTSAKIADGTIVAGDIADSTITLAKLASAVANALVPVGTIAMYGGASAPTGWLLCDGTSTTGYTALAAIVGSTTPDMRGRFAIGDNSTLTLLGTGGSTTIAEGNLPLHTHTFSATTASSTTGISLSTTGSHVHVINGVEALTGLDTVGDILQGGAGGSAYTEDTGSAGSHTHTVTDSGHTHTLSGTTGSVGSGTAYYQPYLVVNYIIKHD